ncbi:hypothetical protein BFP77_08375 [Maribacter sp. 4U21]|nr:hypothetical protein BFP77_08375 [Maribacter sp. 4U21]
MTDLAVQTYGRPEAAVQMALDNDQSLTDELVPGAELLEVEFENPKTEITAFYSKKEIYPATAITDGESEIIDNNDPCNLCKCFT